MTDYYNFFFSFASVDWKRGKRDDLQVFFEDLKSKLTEFGLEGSGFLAPDSIARGAEWEKELRNALSASSVLVPIYSPNYFKSVWCGKEWEVFWLRQQENQNMPPADVRGPNVILPVIWTAEFLELPTRVKAVQCRHPVADAQAYGQKGLGYVMQAPRRFPGIYRDFVHQFGAELATMVQAQGAAKMRPIPRLEQLDLPFPAQYKLGLSHVQFVFLAGRRDEMTSRTRHDCYGTYEDRYDWRPCFPEPSWPRRTARDACKMMVKFSTRYFNMASCHTQFVKYILRFLTKHRHECRLNITYRFKKIFMRFNSFSDTIVCSPLATFIFVISFLSGMSAHSYEPINGLRIFSNTNVL